MNEVVVALGNTRGERLRGKSPSITYNRVPRDAKGCKRYVNPLAVVSFDRVYGTWL
jgi:hypothetical protein